MKNQERINGNRKIVTSGAITYVAFSAPGVAASVPAWQVKKIDASDENDIRITWADGDDKFDNVATDLPLLTYMEIND